MLIALFIPGRLITLFETRFINKYEQQYIWCEVEDRFAVLALLTNNMQITDVQCDNNKSQHAINTNNEKLA